MFGMDAQTSAVSSVEASSTTTTSTDSPAARALSTARRSRCGRSCVVMTTLTEGMCTTVARPCAENFLRGALLLLSRNSLTRTRGTLVAPGPAFREERGQKLPVRAGSRGPEWVQAQGREDISTGKPEFFSRHLPRRVPE